MEPKYFVFWRWLYAPCSSFDVRWLDPKRLAQQDFSWTCDTWDNTTTTCWISWLNIANSWRNFCFLAACDRPGSSCFFPEKIAHIPISGLANVPSFTSINYTLCRQIDHTGCFCWLKLCLTDLEVKLCNPSNFHRWQFYVVRISSWKEALQKKDMSWILQWRLGFPWGKWNSLSHCVVGIFSGKIIITSRRDRLFFSPAWNPL